MTFRPEPVLQGRADTGAAVHRMLRELSALCAASARVLEDAALALPFGPSLTLRAMVATRDRLQRELELELERLGACACGPHKRCGDDTARSAQGLRVGEGEASALLAELHAVEVVTLHAFERHRVHAPLAAETAELLARLRNELRRDCLLLDVLAREAQRGLAVRP